MKQQLQKTTLLNGRSRGYIKKNYQSILSILRTRSGNETVLFDKLLTSMSNAVDKDYSNQKIFEPYNLLNPNSIGPRLHENTNKNDKLFLKELLYLCSKNKFHLLSSSESNYAELENYMLTLNVVGNVKYLNSNLFGMKKFKDIYKFTNTHVDFPKRLSPNVLLLHRGVGVTRTKGFFYLEKIDELVRRSFKYILQGIANQIKKSIERQQKNMKSTYLFQQQLNLVNYFQSTIKPSLDINTENARIYLESRGYIDKAKIKKQVKETHSIDTSKNEQIIDIELERAIEHRKNLSDTPLGLFDFLFQIELLEPTYKNMILIYRKLDPDPPKASQDDVILVYDSNRRNYQNVHVQIFNDIPMTDIELLLPYKDVQIRAADRLKLFVSLLISGSISLPLLVYDGAALSYGYLIALGSSLSYLFRILYRTWFAQIYYATFVASLYPDNILSNNEASLYYLLAEASEQQKKELAIILLSIVELNKEFNIHDLEFKIKNVLEKELDFQNNYLYLDIKSNLDLLLKYNIISIVGETSNNYANSKQKNQHPFLYHFAFEDNVNGLLQEHSNHNKIYKLNKI